MHAGPPLRLRTPSRFQAVRFEHDATVELDVEDRVSGRQSRRSDEPTTNRCR
jgi:hypothetical protein